MNTIALAIACGVGAYGVSCATIEISENCPEARAPSLWPPPRLQRAPSDGGAD